MDSQSVDRKTGIGYPVLLHLTGRQCVVVGGGRVAVRKVKDLIEAGAQVTVISPVLESSLAALTERGLITVISSEYSVGMLAAIQPFLVFAATDSSVVNQQVAAEARDAGALVDSVEGYSETNDFSSMATMRQGLITIAIATQGAAPALAVHLHTRLGTIIGSEYGTFAQWLSELRPVVLERVSPQQQRRDLWWAMINSSALDLLRQGNETEAYAIVQKLLDNAIQETMRDSR
ncbi:MAG: NAD(P)-dependent oxidoreductase [Chloroflexota bacterium]